MQDPKLVKNLVCKEFNIRETSSEAWLTFEQIDNRETFDIKELKPRYGIGGCDLSSTTDLTNATVIFKVPKDERIYVLQMYWLPEDLLEQRTREDKIPYDIWLKMVGLEHVQGIKCITNMSGNGSSRYKKNMTFICSSADTIPGRPLIL